MKTSAWLPHDVYFGDPGATPPDWRSEMDEDGDDDMPLSDDDRKALIAQLGFDPEELAEACVPNKSGKGHHDDKTGSPCSLASDEPKGEKGNDPGSAAHDSPLSPDHEKELAVKAESKAKRILKAVTSLPGKVVPQRVKDAAKKAKDAVIGAMQQRYGERGTSLILKAAAYSAPIPLPGTQPAAIVASLVIAEGVLLAKRLFGKKKTEAEEELLTAAQIKAEAARLWDEVLKAASESLKVEEAVQPNKTGPGCHDTETGHPAVCPGGEEGPGGDGGGQSTSGEKGTSKGTSKADTPHRFASESEADSWGLETYENFKEPPRKKRRKDGTVKIIDSPGKGGLSQDEYNLLRSYTLTGYNVINGMLRSGKERKPIEEEWIKRIDGVMARNKTDRAVMAYRAASSPELRKAFDDAVNGQVGGTIQDKAYVSTGLQMDAPEWFYTQEAGDDKVMLEIHIPAGTPSMALEHIGHAGEQELLLSRDSTFEIVGAHEKEGKRWLLVKWISGHGDKAT